MRLLWILLLTPIILCLTIESVKGAKNKPSPKEDDDEKPEKSDKPEKPEKEEGTKAFAKGAKGFKNLFAGLFGAGGKKAFKKIVAEGKKAFKKGSMDGKGETDDEDLDVSDEEEVDPKDPKAIKQKMKKLVTIAIKAFVFNTKLYGCQHSKTYQTFLKSVKNGTTGAPEEDPENKQDKWLKKLADSAGDIEIEEDSMTLEEVQEKIDGLDEDQRAILMNAEKDMPLVAVTFLHFVRVYSCANTRVSKYLAFTEAFKQEVEITAKKNKKFPNAYYLHKADIVMFEIGLD